MAAKRHPMKDGTGASKCDARKQTCPNGGDSEHFATKKEALAHVEAQAAQENEVNGNGSLPSGITKPSAGVSQASHSISMKALEQARNKVAAMSHVEKVDAARDKNTPAEILAVLAEDIDRWVRAYAASNTNTSKELLTVLGRDGDRVVRGKVAQNDNTPVGLLATLAKDDKRWVRECVASNKNTPVGVLTTLAKDENHWVRECLAKNPSTDPDVLVSLSYDNHASVSRAAAQNPSLPYERISELSEYGNENQRKDVAYNPFLPYENLLLMLGDSSEKVRQRAEVVLCKRNGSAKVD